MKGQILHQMTVGAMAGDAITDHVFLLRRWLREMGFTSEVFAEHIHPNLDGDVKPLSAYRPDPREQWVIYHHSIGSSVVDTLLALPVRLIVVYHNVTPPRFFSAIDPPLARQMEEGRRQLELLRSRTGLALGVSPFNEAELSALGFERTAVLPLALDESWYQLPSNPAILRRYNGTGPLLLFVGRLVPNKKQEDLIKLLYFYRRIKPAARLILVGAAWVPQYEAWLHDLTRDLGLDEAVLFAGHVSHEDMLTYYRIADLYVSMSEHEGFGKPLIESMYLGLPVLAYAAAGVPSTLDSAGVLFHHKEYEALAELVGILVEDERLRRRIITVQHERARLFLEPAVRQRWEEHLKSLL